MARAGRVGLLVLGLALLCAGPASAAQRLVTIDAPSRFVDAEHVRFAGANHPRKLQANVLLPDGYDPGRAYPLLLLVHGASGRWDSWAIGSGGQIRDTAKGLDAIVVMPDGGEVGFYSDWLTDSRQQWERYFRDELIPLIERRYRIRAGRRWHAIGGLSMGGYGAAYLASQMPGYFGHAIPLSGPVSTQRTESEIGIRLVGGVEYRDIWGVPEGFFASGHNPLKLTGNLRQTRFDVYTGIGVPRPDRLGIGGGLSPLAEFDLWVENNEFVEALHRAGAPTTYTPMLGTHDWPYWRDHLRAAIRRGLFPPVSDDPANWNFRTVSNQGDAWGLRFSFASAPRSLIDMSREGRRLRARGQAGELRVEDRGGCRYVSPLPAAITLATQPCRRLRLKLTPARVRTGRRTRVAVRATEGGAAVAGARVRLGKRAATTDAGGRARFRVRPRRSGRVAVRAVKDTYRDGTARLRVLRAR